MKFIIIIAGIITGGFMLVDGMHVLLKGKYIGPPKPGPWASLFDKINVDVFKLGPLFIAFGLAWLIFIGGFWMQKPWAHTMGIVLSILTLWYLPVGTLISIIVLILLLKLR